MSQIEYLETSESLLSFLEDENRKGVNIRENRENNGKYITDLFNKFDEEEGITTNSLKINVDEEDKVCINCGLKNYLVNDTEKIVCTNCGCENDIILEDSPEWRFYGNDDNKRSSDPNRCGGPLSPYIANSSLSTVILGRGFESYRKVNSWNGPTYRERTLIHINNLITNKANIENVPQSVIDQTMFMYQKICTRNIKRGTARESLIAVCFAYAMRENGFLRSHAEIANLFNIKTKKFTKSYNEFSDLVHTYNQEYINSMRPTTTKDLVEHYCKYFDFSQEQKISALIALKGVEKLVLCQENNPKSIAVGVIYLICEYYNLPYTKRDIADYCKTSEVTVNGTYSQMLKYVKYLIPQK
jgi:transcription initiation factor TFIIIB Brf1 subunit/transcription initiation factor TFIIB